MIGTLTVKVFVRPGEDEWRVFARHERPDGLWDTREVQTGGSTAFERAVEYVPVLLRQLIEEANARA